MVSRYVSNYQLSISSQSPNGLPPPPHHLQQIPMSVLAAAQQQQQSQLQKVPSSDYHVQTCLVQSGPPQPTQQHSTVPHYRIVHSRPDYHVANQGSVGYSTQTGAPQSNTQIRGGPPNAPPTPPQQDLNKISSQSTMIHSYQSTARPQNQNQQTFRNIQSQVRAPRQPMMQQQMFQPIVMSQFHPYQQTPRHNSTQWSQNPPYPCAPIYTSIYPYTMQHSRQMNPPNNSQPALSMQQNVLGNQNVQQPTAPVGIGTSATGSNVSLGSHQHPQQPRKRRPNAVPIIDQHTGKDLLDDIIGESSSITPKSTVVSCVDAVFDENDVNNPNIISQSFVNEPNISDSIDIIPNNRIPIAITTPIIVQEPISATPVVSAKSDGPSVEITTKPSTVTKKRKNPADYAQTNNQPSSVHQGNMSLSNEELAVQASLVSLEVITNSISDTSSQSTVESASIDNEEYVYQENQKNQQFINQALENETESIDTSYADQFGQISSDGPVINKLSQEIPSNIISITQSQPLGSLPPPGLIQRGSSLECAQDMSSLPETSLPIPVPVAEQQLSQNSENLQLSSTLDNKKVAKLEDNISTVNSKTIESTTDTTDDRNNNSEISSSIKTEEYALKHNSISKVSDSNDNLIVANNKMENIRDDNLNENIEVIAEQDSKKNSEKIDVENSVDLITESSIEVDTATQSMPTPAQQLLIQYVAGQWSPLNQEGKKFYSREQLFKLQENPKSKEKPKNLPDNCEVSLNQIRDSNRNDHQSGHNSFAKQYSAGNDAGNGNNLLPSFANKGMPQKGGHFQGKRISSHQSNNKQLSGSKNSSKSDVIHVSLSLREDIKLNEAENAWKPAHLADDEKLNEDEQNHMKLMKRVRGILNKLTPEKFQALLSQLRSCVIDTPTKLRGVIELIFEKAVDEPNFAVAYAQMCSALSTIEVTSPDSTPPLNFRKILLTICQGEFEKITNDNVKSVSHQKKLEQIKDPEKRLELEEEDRKMRRRSVGTIRFIGELFKFELLTGKIMLACIKLLLDRGEHEESLECLCKLLTTVGKSLCEKSKSDCLEVFIDQMQDIVKKKSHNVSSRVRFMLQDVIDLKKSGWVPRRTDLNPKKMGEIQKEAETEQLNIQLMNYPTQRKDERRGGNNSNNNSGGNNMMQSFNNKGKFEAIDGWLTQNSKNRSPYSSIDTSKFSTKTLNIDSETRLGQPSNYKWNSGSKFETHSSNMYNVLELDNKSAAANSGPSSFGGSSGNKSKDSYHSKGSLERERYGGNKFHNQNRLVDDNPMRMSAGSRSLQPMMSGRLSSSSSSHQKYMGSSSSQNDSRTDKLSSGIQASKLSGNSSNTSLTTSSKDRFPEPEPDYLDTHVTNKMCTTLEEFHNGFIKMEDVNAEIKQIDERYRWCIPRELYNYAFERTDKYRILASDILINAINAKLIRNDQIKYGLKSILDLAEEYSIDLPKIWNYIAVILGPFFKNKILNLRDLESIAAVPISQNLGNHLIKNLFQHLYEENGPKFVRELWMDSNVSWNTFIIHPHEIENFINTNKLQFVTSATATVEPPVNSQINMTSAKEKIIGFLKENSSFDSIIDWINGNVKLSENKPLFIRSLTSAILEHCIEQVIQPNNSGQTYKLNVKAFTQHVKLLHRYIQNKDELELQCMYTLQKVITIYEHPAGVLRSIVDILWDSDTISVDGFTKWKSSTDPKEQAGKGVILSSLVSFFTSLTEHDSSDDGGDDEK